MSVRQTEAPQTVVLCGISREMYEGVLEAVGRYHLRHTYVRGMLELPNVLYGVEWSDYLRLLDVLGDYNLRHTYYRGTLEMMLPRKDHEWVKRMIGCMIEAMALDLDIQIQSVGSMTLTSDAVDCGLQPDESYYVANEPLVRGKAQYDPKQDPPPDLVIEVDLTHSSVKRLAAFAQLGVPEIWRHDGKKVIFYQLSEGEYHEVDCSVSFPFIAPSDVMKSLKKSRTTSENALVRAFVKGARERYLESAQE